MGSLTLTEDDIWYKGTSGLILNVVADFVFSLVSVTLQVTLFRSHAKVQSGTSYEHWWRMVWDKKRIKLFHANDIFPHVMAIKILRHCKSSVEHIAGDSAHSSTGIFNIIYRKDVKFVNVNCRSFTCAASCWIFDKRHENWNVYKTIGIILLDSRLLHMV